MKYLGVLCFLALVFIPVLQAVAWADNAPQTLGEQASSSMDALKKADKYSFDTGGIGILIVSGTGNGTSADKIGDAFVNEIKKRGVQSRYYYYTTDCIGMAIEFYIGYSAMGPWNVDYAASQVSKVVARAKAAQKIHAYTRKKQPNKN